MKALNLSYYGQSKLWWLVMIVGILMVLGGFCYWFWPVAGYEVASLLFGWLLIVAALVQLCVSSGENRPKGWGWWLAGGVIDMFIGFVLVRNLPLAMEVFPYFMAFFFIYWGIEQFVSASSSARHLWWLGIINGILLCVIGFLFVESGLRSTIFMSSFLVSIAFIYWGFTISMAAYEMKPQPRQ
ncbi:MAG: DUF308 domain-containing protein [Bacteroidales bacterium]|nr:DUF308 domain-containing protein [Bacteroidales bacterium]